MYSSQQYSKPKHTNQRMWCEDFLSTYRNAPVDHIISKYYDRLSVFVEATGDGRWTEPVIGAHKITVRLAALNASGGCGWPVVTCQRMRFDGLIVVLAADDGYQRQILIVHWRKATRRAVVSNHIYLITGTNGVGCGGGDGSWESSFHSRFNEWTGRLDRGSLVRFKTALCTGLTVVRNYYSTLPEHPADRADRNLYHRAARFSYTRPDGGGGGRVYVGPRAIHKQYGRLAMDYRCVRLRAVETCWSGYSRYIPGTTVALTVGVVPKTAGPGRTTRDLEFVQLFVIDVRTRKIINDVLCFEPRRDGLKSSSSTSLLSSSSLSSLSSTPSQQPSLSSASSNPFISVFTSSSSSCSNSSSSNKIDARLPIMLAGVSNVVAYERNDSGELATLRSRVMANTLGIRYAVIVSGCAIGGSSGGHQTQQNVTSSKLNPRQLFIGCVPLHVKYGQLKLLFERFGEVTYVKVYEGYNKQTGVKMLHNYAFLFFKDEKSVDSAIAASPIPLDSNCNLNVSRPHHHTTTVGLDR